MFVFWLPYFKQNKLKWFLLCRVSATLSRFQSFGLCNKTVFLPCAIVWHTEYIETSTNIPKFSKSRTTMNNLYEYVCSIPSWISRVTLFCIPVYRSWGVAWSPTQGIWLLHQMSLLMSVPYLSCMQCAELLQKDAIFTIFWNNSVHCITGKYETLTFFWFYSQEQSNRGLDLTSDPDILDPGVSTRPRPTQRIWLLLQCSNSMIWYVISRKMKCHIIYMRTVQRINSPKVSNS